ncbi:hypothetical protein F5B19DRAFT_473921 [Rostrohypoxylon terebratum]|nr:hypothetical protein F5B19DRAFT_473921 [Rostrohypoxylon terebratum]
MRPGCQLYLGIQSPCGNTPVELSSKMGHYLLTRVLIQNNANINQNHRHALISEDSEDDECGGALWCAFDRQVGDPPTDLIDLLIENGSYIGKKLTYKALRSDIYKPLQPLCSERSHLVLRLLRASTSSHADFWRDGIFHDAISTATREVVKEIFWMVCSITSIPINSDQSTMKLMDILAKQGQLNLVQHLHAAGCCITEHALTYAIWSREIQLIQFLLENGAKVDSFIQSKTYGPGIEHSSNGIYTLTRPVCLFTPCSEAIRIRNEELSAQFMLNPALQNGDTYQLAAALYASAETGNFELQHQLLHLIESLTFEQMVGSWEPGIGSSASRTSYLSEAIYHCLIGSISRDDNDIALLAFKSWFEITASDNSYDRPGYFVQLYDELAAFAFRFSLQKRNHQMTRLFLQLNTKFLDFNSPLYDYHSYTFVLFPEHNVPDEERCYQYTINNPDPLFLAVQWGDKSIIEDILFLLKSSVRLSNGLNSSPLGIAVRREDLFLLIYLIDSGIPTFNVDLVAAVRTGNVEIVKLLLEKGAKLIPKAFEEAIERGTDMIDLLLSSLAQRKLQLESLHPIQECFDSPMWKIIRQNNVHLVRRFLELGAEIGSESILEAASANREILDLLLRAVDDRYSDNRWGNGTRALCESIARNDLCLVKRLLTHRVDLERFAPYPDGESNRLYGDGPRRPIRQQRMMQFHDKETALPLAVAIDKDRTHNQQILRAVLDLGTSKFLDGVIYQADGPVGTIQETALLRAVERQDLAILGLLVDSGADVNLPAGPVFRRTPLQRAVELGALEVVQFLLGRGANANLGPAQYAGGTALQLAAIEGFAGIVEFLLTKGADVNAKSAWVHGRTALEGAAEHGRLDTVALLLQAGVASQEMAGANLKRLCGSLRKSIIIMC